MDADCWFKTVVPSMMNEPARKYNKEDHRWTRHKRGIAHEVCGDCGLVRLRNPISELCAKLGCNYDLHPRYLRWLRHIRSGGSSFEV
jgi:hypothetical protein